MMKRLPIRDYVIQGLTTFVIALLTLGPLTAWKLESYEVSTNIWQAFRLAGCLTLIRLLYLSFSDRFGIGTRSSGSVHTSGQKTQQLKKFFLPLIAVIGLLFPFAGGNYALTVAITALIYVLLGLGLNIVVGLAGLLDLGFVAFYAVGAYCYALGAEHFGLGFWGALPLAASMAACLGCVLAFPVLRMHGDYLAIVTLGFGEIIRLILNNWIDFTGGPNGIRAPYPTFFGLEFTRSARTEGGQTFHEFFGLEYSSDYRYMFIYLTLILFVALVIYLVSRLKHMSIGRAWEALREDEIACRSLGINHVTVKLSAFAIGASIAGVAGVFFACYQGFINPTSFNFFESALILAIVVLGGLGSISGVVIAAVVLSVLPEVLRQFAEYRVLLLGIIMVVTMIWKPKGLISSSRTALKSKVH
jgi:branched-chain amino acid transport system permease protein